MDSVFRCQIRDVPRPRPRTSPRPYRASDPCKVKSGGIDQEAFTDTGRLYGLTDKWFNLARNFSRRNRLREVSDRCRMHGIMHGIIYRILLSVKLLPANMMADFGNPGLHCGIWWCRLRLPERKIPAAVYDVCQLRAICIDELNALRMPIGATRAFM